MGFFKKKIKVVTHDGNFHADDVFAVATLSILHDDNIEIIRSRDPKVIQTADYAVDVNYEYNPEKNRFDHHQTGGAGKRKNGVPYSGFGLIWKHFGMKLVSSEEAFKIVDEKIVQSIDATDTAHEDFGGEKSDIKCFTLDDAVKAFNPIYKEDFSNSDKYFKMNVEWAKRLMKRLIEIAESNVEGIKLVEDLYNKTEDKRLIISDETLPLRKVLTNKPEPLYAIVPNKQNGHWKILAISKNEGTYESRKLLPESWRGKIGEEIIKITEIEDATFCHGSGFLAGAKTKESAIKMAKIALES